MLNLLIDFFMLFDFRLTHYRNYKFTPPYFEKANFSKQGFNGAKKVSIKKPFERIMIMEYELTGIGKIKMTVGVRRRTLEKVQYCITAISSE